MIYVARTKQIITPQKSLPLMGHAMRKESAIGAADELEVHLLSIVAEDVCNLWISADLISFSYELVDRIKFMLKQALHLESEQILLSATHTHSGPYVFDSPFHDVKPDCEYVDEVCQKIVEGAMRIVGHEKTCDHVLYQKGQSKGYYGNRNSKDKPGDPWIHVLRFQDQENRDLAVLVNLSCHCTVLSPLELHYSADLFGALRRQLQKLYQVEPLMANGNAGDISNRQYRIGNDLVALETMACNITTQISQFSDSQNIELNALQVKSLNFVVEYENNHKMLHNKLNELQSKLSECEEFDERKWLISEIAGCERKLKQHHVKVEIKCSIRRLGDLEIIALPCELASAFGLQLKRASSAPCCLVWGYAEGHSTYVVEASEFQSGHDGISTMLPKGKAEELIGLLIQSMFD